MSEKVLCFTCENFNPLNEDWCGKSGEEVDPIELRSCEDYVMYAVEAVNLFRLKEAYEHHREMADKFLKLYMEKLESGGNLESKI